MARSTELEVEANGKWEIKNVDDALAIGKRYGQCVKCHEPARAHRRGKNGAAAHVEHLSRNKKCPLSDCTKV
jgi:RNA polymerase-binding transcription factor DksA